MFRAGCQARSCDSLKLRRRSASAERSIARGDRDNFIRCLYRQGGVQPVQHYLPNYLFTIYKERGYKPGLCPVAEDMFFHKTFNLPMHPRLTKQDCDNMIDGVAMAIKQAKKSSNGR